MPSDRVQIKVRPEAGRDGPWREAALADGLSLNAWILGALDRAVAEPRSSGDAGAPTKLAAGPPGRSPGTPKPRKPPAAAEDERKQKQGCWDHRDSPKPWCRGCQAAA